MMALTPRIKPKTVDSVTYEVKTACGNLYITIGYDNAGITDVFVRFGKNGTCATAQNEALGRLLTLSFRCGIDPEEIIDAIKGIRCTSTAYDEKMPILSCADAVAKALQKFLSK